MPPLLSTRSMCRPRPRGHGGPPAPARRERGRARSDRIDWCEHLSRRSGRTFRGHQGLGLGRKLGPEGQGRRRARTAGRRGTIWMLIFCSRSTAGRAGRSRVCVWFQAPLAPRNTTPRSYCRPTRTLELIRTATVIATTARAPGRRHLVTSLQRLPEEEVEIRRQSIVSRYGQEGSRRTPTRPTSG